MKTMKKNPRLAGARAKANGEIFETLFHLASRRHRVKCTRIPDGCKQIGARRIIRVRSPWDWVLSYAGKTALIDTKCTLEGTFGNSQIEPHQVKEMIEHELEGQAIAGYVIWTKKNDQVFFIPSSHLCTLLKIRGSINHKHPQAISLGTIQTLDPKKLFQKQSSLEKAMQPEISS